LIVVVVPLATRGGIVDDLSIDDHGTAVPLNRAKHAIHLCQSRGAVVGLDGIATDLGAVGYLDHSRTAGYSRLSTALDIRGTQVQLLPEGRGAVVGRLYSGVELTSFVCSGVDFAFVVVIRNVVGESAGSDADTRNGGCRAHSARYGADATGCNRWYGKQWCGTWLREKEKADGGRCGDACIRRRHCCGTRESVMKGGCTSV
jgi:hypothetical protein